MVLVGAAKMAEGEGLCVSKGWWLWFSFLGKGRGQRLHSMEKIRVFLPKMTLKMLKMMQIYQKCIFFVFIIFCYFWFFF
jgi:TRAP-type C4-dicarboxylate transport system permease small subunit